MAKTISKTFLVFILFYFPICTYGKLSDSMRYELEKVSRQMYEEKNNNFVIVDAIIDGVIKLESPYTFQYDTSGILVDKKRLAPALSERYKAKIKGYLPAKGVTSNSFSMYSLKGLTLTEIFDASSDFRRESMQLANFMNNRPGAYKPVVDFAASLGLIDTTGNYSIRYNILGLFVNDKPLSEAQAINVVKMINAMGFTAISKEDQLYIDRSQTLLSRHQ